MVHIFFLYGYPYFLKHCAPFPQNKCFFSSFFFQKLKIILFHFFLVLIVSDFYR